MLPGTDSTGILLEFDRSRQGFNTHEDERSENPGRQGRFSKNSKIVMCLLSQCLASISSHYYVFVVAAVLCNPFLW